MVQIDQWYQAPILKWPLLHNQTFSVHLKTQRTIYHLNYVVHLLASVSPGVRLAMVTIIFFFVFPQFYLTMFSNSSLQLLLSFAVVLHSPPRLTRPLLTKSSHCIFSLPCVLFPFTFRASDLHQFFVSPFLSTWLAHFNLLLTMYHIEPYATQH